MPNRSIVQKFRAERVSSLAAASHDKRTIGSTKAAARAAAERYGAAQIGARLGISHQKWTAIKRGIEKGRVYSPEIRNKLNQIGRGEARIVSPARVAPRAQVPILWTMNEGIRYTTNVDAVKKYLPWAHAVKTLLTLDEARKYAEKAPKDYFILVKQESRKQPGKYLYRFLETRTPREIQRKGKVQGITRAEQVFKDNFREVDEDPTEEQ